MDDDFLQKPTEAGLLTSLFAEIYLAWLFLLKDHYIYHIRHPLRLNDGMFYIM